MAQQISKPVEVPGETHVVIAKHLPIAKGAVEAVENFEIETDRDNEFAGTMLDEIKTQHALVDKERKKISEPLYQAWTATNAFFRPVLTELLNAESKIKKKIADYARAQREANMRALGAAATDKEAFDKLELVSTAAPAGISMREVWKFEVVDANAVPRAYCSPDPAKLREMAKVLDDSASTEVGGVIDGVRFYKDDIVTSRRKT